MDKSRKWIAIILAAILSVSLYSVSQNKDLSYATEEKKTSGNFSVTWIDVGHGDSALIRCDGHAMLIDGGEPEESDKIYSFLKSDGISYLDYIVATHTHEDHIGGLSGALNAADVGTAYCPVTSDASASFENFTKYLGRQGKAVTVPACGSTFSLGSASVRVLGPVDMNTTNVNNTSIILKITYGSTSFLFMGDAESEEEADLIAGTDDLSATVMKVGHHGSNSSSTWSFLTAVKPQYAVISCGENDTYGEPTSETLDKLQRAGAEIYRTDLQGNITCTSDGNTVSFTTEKEADGSALLAAGTKTGDGTEAVSETSSEAAADYVLNTNTKKFHRPTCSKISTMKAKNRKDFNGTREELIEQGYSPCSVCKP